MVNNSVGMQQINEQVQRFKCDSLKSAWIKNFNNHTIRGITN